MVFSFFDLNAVASNVDTPLAAMQRRARELRQASNDLLQPEVDWLRGVDDEMVYRFRIAVPALDNYKITIADYRQPPAMFPGILKNVVNDREERIPSFNKFSERFDALLASEKVRTVLAALLAQSRSATKKPDDATPPPPPSRTR